MKNGKLQIAVIGCGGMSRFYIPRYTRIPGAELALVVDAKEEIARAAGDRYHCRWSTEFSDCLAPEIDMVDISTPNFLHADQAVAAIEAGKHVILQKPITPTVEEAERILTAARKTDKNVGMYMSKFNIAAVYDIKQILDKGLLGRVEGIHCRSAHPGGLHEKAGSWRSNLKLCGGGSFLQLGIHTLDLVQFLLGSRIREVMAFSHNTMCPNIGGDDATTVACRFENGVLGTLESSYCASSEDTQIFGTDGYVRWEAGHGLNLCLREPFSGKTINYTQPGIREHFSVTDGLELYGQANEYDQSVAFVRAILEGRRAPVPVEVGVYDLKVIKAVYASAQSGARVTV